MDLGYYWKIFRRRLPYVIILAALGTAIGVSLAMTLPPDAPRYDAVVPLDAQTAVAGGAKPLPAAQPMQPDMGANDCFAFFNPTSAEELNLVADTWADALLVASEYVAAHHEDLASSGS